MIDTMLIFAYVVSFACGLFVGAVAMYTFFALVNSDIIDKDKLSQLWEDVNYVSDSIVKGYINAADLKRTLREEWDIHI